MVRVLEKFTIQDVERIWDSLAKKRFNQVSSGRDITFNKVLAPAIVDEIRFAKGLSILDAGCGTGVLARDLNQNGAKIVGVDASSLSIKIAENNFGHIANYIKSSIEEYAETSTLKFDVIVANMVLMDVPNLRSFLRALRRLSHSETKFIWTITHPFFWPKYYGYENEEWFDYNKELFVEDIFRTSNSMKNDLVSVHVHRPLGNLSKALAAEKWGLLEILEPFPSSRIQKLYSQPWSNPRYMLGSCRALTGVSN